MTFHFCAELSALAQPGHRLLFYPSCGDAVSFCFHQGCDVVVLADFAAQRESFWPNVVRRLGDVALVTSSEAGYVFRYAHRWGFLYACGNNEVLDYLRTTNHRIATFVGICDGCQEGGNYECVNGFPFLSKVLALADPTGMTYLTDHLALLPDPARNVASARPVSELVSPERSLVIGDKHIRLRRPRPRIRPRQWGPVYELTVSGPMTPAGADAVQLPLPGIL